MPTIMHLFANIADCDGSRFRFVAETMFWVTAVVSLLVAALPAGRRSTHRHPYKHVPWTIGEKIIYWACVAMVAALGFSSLTSVFKFKAMHGWWLASHVTAGGVYVVLVAAMAEVVSRRFGAARRSLSNEREHATHSKEQPTRPAGHLIATQLAVRGYWLMLVLSLLVVGTILLTLLPVFETRDLERLIVAHRYCGLGLLAIALVHPIALWKWYR